MTEPTQIDPNRNEDGTFKTGGNSNPEGNNGNLKGWQKYGTRLQTWLEKPGEEIEALFDAEGKKTKELMKKSVIDITAAMHARDMISEDPTVRGPARKEAVDRTDGRVAQSLRVGGDPDNETPIGVDGKFTLTFGTDDNDSDPTTA